MKTAFFAVGLLLLAVSSASAGATCRNYMDRYSSVFTNVDRCYQLHHFKRTVGSICMRMEHKCMVSRVHVHRGFRIHAVKMALFEDCDNIAGNLNNNGLLKPDAYQFRKAYNGYTKALAKVCFDELEINNPGENDEGCCNRDMCVVHKISIKKVNMAETYHLYGREASCEPIGERALVQKCRESIVCEA